MPRRNAKRMEALARESVWTLIGPGSVIHGELLMAGNVIVHGRVEGILFTDGEVQVAAEGMVEGGIHARRVVIEGMCEGGVEATDEVILRAGSVVRGQIEARILSVDDGARFLGSRHHRESPTGPRILAGDNHGPGRA